jgi:hypothetical protein
MGVAVGCDHLFKVTGPLGLLAVMAMFACDDAPASVDVDATPGPGDIDQAHTPDGSTPQQDTGSGPGAPDTTAEPGDEEPPAPGHDCANPHPDWLFCEDFEAGDGNFETWFAASDFLTASGENNRDRIDLSSEHTRSGQWAVYMPNGEGGEFRGADLVWYACEGEQRTNCALRGYDKLYFRTWVRFAEDHRYVHHWLNIAGLDRFWAYGSAGCLPNGTSSMGTTVDFRRDTHETFFYTYHLDMGCDWNCGRYMDVAARCQRCEDIGFPTCTEREQCCWGNHFTPDPPVRLPVGEWFCFEMMMEANTPGEPDGKMTYWVNDALGHHAEGLRWRTTPDLQLNRVALQHYIEAGSVTSPNRVWFDDVVVSTSRIGCQ